MIPVRPGHGGGAAWFLRNVTCEHCGTGDLSQVTTMAVTAGYGGIERRGLPPFDQ